MGNQCRWTRTELYFTLRIPSDSSCTTFCKFCFGFLSDSGTFSLPPPFFFCKCLKVGYCRKLFDKSTLSSGNYHVVFKVLTLHLFVISSGIFAGSLVRLAEWLFPGSFSSPLALLSRSRIPQRKDCNKALAITPVTSVVTLGYHPLNLGELNSSKGFSCPCFSESVPRLVASSSAGSRHSGVRTQVCLFGYSLNGLFPSETIKTLF